MEVGESFVYFVMIFGEKICEWKLEVGGAGDKRGFGILAVVFAGNIERI